MVASGPGVDVEGGAIIFALVALVILAIYKRGGASAGGREKRFRELEATQARLHEMLVASEARIEHSEQSTYESLQEDRGLC